MQVPDAAIPDHLHNRSAHRPALKDEGLNASSAGVPIDTTCSHHSRSQWPLPEMSSRHDNDNDNDDEDEAKDGPAALLALGRTRVEERRSSDFVAATPKLARADDRASTCHSKC